MTCDSCSQGSLIYTEITLVKSLYLKVLDEHLFKFRSRIFVSTKCLIFKWISTNDACIYTKMAKPDIQNNSVVRVQYN